MALAPLAVTVSRKVDPAWRWMGLAFAVSFVADMLAAQNRALAWPAALVFPMSQVGLIGAVLLMRADAVRLILALAAVAVLAIVWQGTQAPDVLVYTVACLAVVLIVMDRWESPFRGPLLLYFGLGWVAWMAFSLHPVVATWAIYQGTRALGLGAFCVASFRSPAIRRA